MALIRIIYVSTATKQMSDEELLSLLEQSRERNKTEGITGILFYGGGNFFQILEGEKGSLDRVYSSISKDYRHTGCIILDSSEIKERSFGDWSMAFKRLNTDESSKICGYSNFLNSGVSPQPLELNSKELIGLLYNFKKSL